MQRNDSFERTCRRTCRPAARRGLVVAVTLSWLAAPVASAEADEHGALIALHSRRCLSATEQRQPGVASCNASATITLSGTPGGDFLIRLDRTGQCLFSNADGRFGYYACTPEYSDQRWSWLPAHEGAPMLRAANSGACLFSNHDGRFGVFACTEGYSDQRWQFLPLRRGVVAPPLPSPAPRCPPLRACGIDCEFGQAVDRNGCTLCSCLPGTRPAPPPRLPETPVLPNPAPRPVPDRRSCQSDTDCVIFCPETPGCCNNSCGCTSAIRADQVKAVMAEQERTCARPPRCPPVACRRQEAGYAACRDGRCVPEMVH